MTTITDANCRIAWILCDFERPKWNHLNAHRWQDPLERVMDRLDNEYDEVLPIARTEWFWEEQATVVLEYDSFEECQKYYEKHRKLLLRYFRRLLAEELAEEKRLIQDQRLIEEAEELEILVEQALGA